MTRRLVLFRAAAIVVGMLGMGLVGGVALTATLAIGFEARLATGALGGLLGLGAVLLPVALSLWEAGEGE